MKRMIFWFIASAIVLLGLPWLTVTFVKGDSAMAVCFLLFYAVNPVYAVFAGVHAGRQIKSLWWLPMLISAFFLIGTWLMFSMGENVFILYALIYLILGITAMMLSLLIGNRTTGRQIGEN